MMVPRLEIRLKEMNRHSKKKRKYQVFLGKLELNPFEKKKSLVGAVSRVSAVSAVSRVSAVITEALTWFLWKANYLVWWHLIDYHEFLR